MAGTFSKIYIQVVFAVKNRQNLINPAWEEELYKYISGIVKNKEQKLLAINGMPDHIHLLLGLKPSCSLPDLVREIKKSSTSFISQRRFTIYPFRWQEGYGAFSYSHSQIDGVIKYILNQKKHHKDQTFRSEFSNLLTKFEIEFKPEHLFNWIE